VGVPYAGRSCCRYFHPEAEQTNALTIGWEGGNNLVIPPTHAVGAAVAHLRAAGARRGHVNLICPDAQCGRHGGRRALLYSILKITVY
jgi:hypothetical protein